MILKKKNCVSNKIQYVVRIKNHSHESWPKKKKTAKHVLKTSCGHAQNRHVVCCY